MVDALGPRKVEIMQIDVVYFDHKHGFAWSKTIKNA